MINHSMDFEQVYTAFQPAIHRYLTRLIGNKEAEDVTQDVFVKVNTALTTFRNDSKLSTWLYQIATNTAIDRMRSRSFKQEANETVGLMELEPARGKTGSEKQELLIEDQVIRKEMSQCIQKVIATLPEKFRIVLVLSEMEELKNNEIAAVLGISLSSVKMRLHRAKARLKKELLVQCTFYQSEYDSGLACEPKATTIRKVNATMSKKVLVE